MGDDLKTLSEPWPSGERIKSAIARAAKLAGLSYWRAWDIWYGKARCVGDHEIARISDALKQKQALETRRELSELRLRLERLESALVLSDEAFHRENLGPVRDALRRSR